MELTPIEYLRAQLKRYADRHGYLSYTSRRLSGLLDHLWAEWYEAMPDRAVAATVLRARPMPREELVRRFETAKAQDDATTMVSLLPHVLKLPKDDPDRPQMLNCCGVYGIRSVSRTMPTLIVVALEEAANSAPNWSLLQLKALGNLGIAYRLAGRLYASYMVFRMLIRHLHAFPNQGYEWITYYYLHKTAGDLGKEHIATTALRISQQFWSEDVAVGAVTSFASRCTRQYTLAMQRPEFQRLWTMGKYPFHLLSGYAMALMKNGYPRAAMAVAQKAFTGIQERHSQDLMDQVEMLVLLAAAGYQTGRDDIGDAFMERAQQYIHTDEVARLAAARLKEWTA